VTSASTGMISASGQTFRSYQPGSLQWHAYRQRIPALTYARTQALRAQYLEQRSRAMTIAEAMAYYNDIVDESDPDLKHEPQIKHAIASALGARTSGLPEWAIAVGFIHDVGKLLIKFGLPQALVVGDEWPVGCAPSPRIVCAEFFADNPDTTHPVYGTRLGVYEEGCGLDNVVISFGHDEYLYRVLADAVADGGATLPAEALFPVRYHSAYVIHTEGEYDYLLDARDRRWMPILHAFRDKIDLYTKRAAGDLGAHLPDILGVVHRYVRPDYKLLW
jgi:inositol oxygenase